MKEEQQMEEEEELLLEDEDTLAAGSKQSTMMVFLTSGIAGHAAHRGNSLWRLCGQEEGREVEEAEEEEEEDPDEAEVVVTQQRMERCLILASLPLVLLIAGVQDRCAHSSVARNLTMDSSLVAAPYVVRTAGRRLFFVAP